MARKKKQQHSENIHMSGGFVPATTDSGRLSSSNSFSFGEEPNGGPVAASGSFEHYSRDTADYSNRKKGRMKTSGKVAIVIIVIALIAGVSALGVYIYKETQKRAINTGLHDMSADIMESIDKELSGMTTFEEPFTVLLLGSDERTGELEEDIGARTDTIILCRIDPTKNTLSMVSLPRDTKMELDGVGTAKLNAAYTYGGPSGTIAAVKKLCGVEIDHYAEINFEGLVGLIDAIGGIDVHVDETIDDPDAGDIVIPEGDQHLDGAAALVFSRSRQYVDGDFTRVYNQRKVIEAIVHKGLEAPASELYGLIQASTSFLTTDKAMDVDFIFSLADQIRHNNDYPVQIYSATIPASTATIDGVSYVIADDAGVAEMMTVFELGGDVGEGNEKESDVLGEDDAENGNADAVIGTASSSRGSYPRAVVD